MNYRKTLVRLFTFLGGIYFFLEFLLPEEIHGYKFSRYNDEISIGLQLTGAMAVGLGLINLLAVHGSKVVFRRRGWFDSSVLLAGLALMLAVTSADWFASEGVSRQARAFSTLADFSRRIVEDAKTLPAAPVPPVQLRNQKLSEAVNAELAKLDAELPSIEPAARGALQESENKVRAVVAVLGDTAPAANESAATALSELASLWREALTARYQSTITKRLYSFLYDGLFVALGSAMFALLGFYIASAAYRAFRVRSMESALMMIAAILVMFGQIPFGIRLWDGFPVVRLWLLTIPNSAAFRAVQLGAAVAGLILGLRMWLSIESESFLKK